MPIWPFQIVHPSRNQFGNKSLCPSWSIQDSEMHIFLIHCNKDSSVAPLPPLPSNTFSNTFCHKKFHCCRFQSRSYLRHRLISIVAFLFFPYPTARARIIRAIPWPWPIGLFFFRSVGRFCIRVIIYTIDTIWKIGTTEG